MMKYKFWLCAILSLSGTIVSHAQQKEPYWTLQLKVGSSLSNVYVGADVNTASDMKWGYHFGMYADYVLPSDLYFQTGLIFESKGAKYDLDLYENGIIYDGIYDFVQENKVNNQNVSVNAIYLQVPLHVGYKLNLIRNLDLNIAVGPYVAYGVGGKSTTTEYDLDGEITKSKSDVFGKDKWKRFDAGFSALLGAEYKKVSFNVGYDFGMINIDRVNEVFNRNLFMNVGYRIF